jgi:hypothetical protein
MGNLRTHLYNLRRRANRAPRLRANSSGVSSTATGTPGQPPPALPSDEEDVPSGTRSRQSTAEIKFEGSDISFQVYITFGKCG